MGRPRLHDVNHDFFDELDSKSAYVYGFMCSDGYNMETRGLIRFHLSSVDTDILSKINEVMDSTYPLHHYISKTSQKLVLLQMSSKKLSSRLADLGCVQKKSSVLEYPQWMPENLTSHFIRGIFDGDGSVNYFFRPQRQSTPEFNFQILGTESICRGIQLAIKAGTGISTGLHEVKNKNNVWIVTKASRRDILSILSWLYEGDDGLFLHRKKEKYFEILEENYDG